jgi:hypothetical protein
MQVETLCMQLPRNVINSHKGIREDRSLFIHGKDITEARETARKEITKRKKVFVQEATNTS